MDLFKPHPADPYVNPVKFSKKFCHSEDKETSVIDILQMSRVLLGDREHQHSEDRKP